MADAPSLNIEQKLAAWCYDTIVFAITSQHPWNTSDDVIEGDRNAQETVVRLWEQALAESGTTNANQFAKSLIRLTFDWCYEALGY